MASIKREIKTCEVSCSHVILDIEGTTSSISFVKDVLFPYIRNNVKDYLNENWATDKVKAIVQALRNQAQEDEGKNVGGVITIPEEAEEESLKSSVLENIKWQMDNDRKTKSLKDLQGLIMEKGYKAGALKGHLYEDVERSLKSWSEQNKLIYIYSSGSVFAQKLLFGHSEKGDMLPFIKDHFDTAVGMKQDVSSYKEILKQISCSPSEAIFLTDVPAEARAAREAGIVAVLVVREGNTPLTIEDKSEFQVITSFDDVEFEKNCKKIKTCSEPSVTVKNKEIDTCSLSNDISNEPVIPCTETPVVTENPKNIIHNNVASGNSEELMDVDKVHDEQINNEDIKLTGETNKIHPKADITAVEGKTECIKEQSVGNKNEVLIDSKGVPTEGMKESESIKSQDLSEKKTEVLSIENKTDDDSIECKDESIECNAESLQSKKEEESIKCKEVDTVNKKGEESDESINSKKEEESIKYKDVSIERKKEDESVKCNGHIPETKKDEESVKYEECTESKKELSVESNKESVECKKDVMEIKKEEESIECEKVSRDIKDDPTENKNELAENMIEGAVNSHLEEKDTCDVQPKKNKEQNPTEMDIVASTNSDNKPDPSSPEKNSETPCESSQTKENVLKKAIIEDTQTENETIVKNDLEETEELKTDKKNVSEICNGAFHETNGKMMNSENKTTNGDANLDLIEKSSPPDASLENKKCDISENTSVVTDVEA